MPSSSTPLRQPLLPQDERGTDDDSALRQLIRERTERLASGEDKLIPDDEFWDLVWEDFKQDHGKYPDEFEDGE